MCFPGREGKNIFVFFSRIDVFPGWGNTYHLGYVYTWLVVETFDSAIHRINHYPADKYYRNQLHYPLDSDLSSG